MIIFFYGPETFKSQKKLQDSKTSFLNKVENSQNSLSYIDGETTDIKEINEKININSLFSVKKLIIIKNIFQNKKPSLFQETLDLLNKNKLDEAGEIVIIFWEGNMGKLTKEKKGLFEFLKNQKFSQEFKKLNQTQLIDWVKNRFLEVNKKIDFKNIQTLLTYCSQDLWHLDQEIKKLIAFSQEEEITTENISMLVKSNFDNNIFNLTDAISNKNKGETLRLLEEQFLNGTNQEYILTMLNRQFKILIQIKEKLQKNKNASEMQKELNLHPFIIKKGIQQANHFKLEELKKLLTKLLELDYLFKKGESDLRTELNLLLANKI